MEEKELIWVPKEKAEEFKKAADEDAQLKIIDDIIHRAKRSMEGDLESLDEDAAYFKGLLIRHKKAYEEVLTEHNLAVEAVWEDINKKMPNFKKSAERALSVISPCTIEVNKISETVNQISRTILDLNDYKLERFVGLMERIANADDKTKELLVQMIDLDIFKGGE